MPPPNGGGALGRRPDLSPYLGWDHARAWAPHVGPAWSFKHAPKTPPSTTVSLYRARQWLLVIGRLARSSPPRPLVGHRQGPVQQSAAERKTSLPGGGSPPQTGPGDGSFRRDSRPRDGLVRPRSVRDPPANRPSFTNPAFRTGRSPGRVREDRDRRPGVFLLWARPLPPGLFLGRSRPSDAARRIGCGAFFAFGSRRGRGAQSVRGPLIHRDWSRFPGSRSVLRKVIGVGGPDSLLRGEKRILEPGSRGLIPPRNGWLFGGEIIFPRRGLLRWRLPAVPANGVVRGPIGGCPSVLLRPVGTYRPGADRPQRGGNGPRPRPGVLGGRPWGTIRPVPPRLAWLCLFAVGCDLRFGAKLGCTDPRAHRGRNSFRPNLGRGSVRACKPSEATCSRDDLAGAGSVSSRLSRPRGVG